MANLEKNGLYGLSPELNIQGLAIDAICDTPIVFECKTRYCFGIIQWIEELTIERITFGHYLLIQKKLSEIGFQITGTTPEAKTITKENVAEVVVFNLEKIIEIIALSVCYTKQEINDLNYAKKLHKIIYKHFTLEAYCYAILGILEKCKTDLFVDHFKIKEDLDRRKTQNKYETVGGRTLWGAFIQNIAKDYGWDYDTIVWGISYQNLTMMRSDESWIDYDSKIEGTENKQTSGTKPSTGKNIHRFANFESLLSFANTKQ